MRSFFSTVTMPLRKVSDLEKTVAAASGVFRDVCCKEPPYHTAEELWEGLKHGDEGVRLLFVFFLCLRKNLRRPKQVHTLVPLVLEKNTKKCYGLFQ